MKCLKIITAIFITYFFAGCKKDHPEDKFSFYYNGQKYNYSVSENRANAGVSRNDDGTPSLGINMVDVFNGIIMYVKPGCAYLGPNPGVQVSPGCVLTSRDSFGNIIPIDSVNVFVYQSGSLNVSFTNCITKSGTDFWTGYNYRYDECTAIGTFDLTLINKNNTTIKLTNGIVNLRVRLD